MDVEMDLSYATKVLLDRIKKLEPKIAHKIIGCILIQDHGERDMIQLACASEKLLENLVHKTKLQLGYFSQTPVSAPLSSPIAISSLPISDAPLNYLPFSPNGPRSFSPQNSYRGPGPHYWDTQLSPEKKLVLSSEYASLSCGDFADEYRLPNQAQYVGFEDQLDPTNGVGNFSGDFYSTDAPLSNSVRKNRQSPSLPDFSVKVCHYFNKGFCKHGNTCRYLHESDNLSMIFGPGELGLEDHVFSPYSLGKLEVEITELLKTRRGNPVSIASLPMLYYEKYRRSLQAEGYLTESQRHGRAGHSLTKLLARLKNIQLIDRAHGQHSVILAEDSSKYYLENRSERNNPGPIVSGSRQIYMTFPADSTFTEKDVSNYFSSFGAVEDVRIPCLQKRMFGFVTFLSANTVETVLAKGNPHIVCESRMLVKPYREKSKLVDRKYIEKNNHSMHYPGNYPDMEHEFPSMGRCDPPRLLRMQLMEQEQELAQALEIERKRFSDFQLECKNIHNRKYMDHFTEELNVSEERFHYLLGVINNSSVSDDRSRHRGTYYADQDSHEIDLPESPFALSIESGISTVI